MAPRTNERRSLNSHQRAFLSLGPMAAAAAAAGAAHDSTPTAPHVPLPPFEYLSRTHRRPSVTDQPMTPPARNSSQSPRTRPLASPHAVRPSSPFTFGTASSLPAHDVQRRRMLRSPASDNHLQSRAELDSRTPPATDPVPTRARSRPPSEHSPQADDARAWAPYDPGIPARRPRPGDDRDHRDVDMHDTRRGMDRPALAPRADEFDYSMRRHSIADVSGRLPSPSDRMRRADLHRGSLGPAAAHTLKRKMSHDRIVYSTLGEESEPNAMAVDSEEPAPKRRGSAFDTRIAQLSLYDRRESVDSRSPVSQLWTDRRDSTSSMFSTLSGYSSTGFSGDVHAKGAPPFPWAAHATQEMHNEADSSRPFDPRGNGTSSDLPHHSSEGRPIPSLPPMHAYTTDRRMSVPDAASKSAERSLRPRSRPPSSRDGAASPDSQTPEPLAKKSLGDAGSLEPMPHPQLAAVQGNSTTPYSRSPELRVSHKLAERKRRKEMKDLFDELRDHLPADRGMKASKWEILSKAVDYIQHLKTSNHDLHRDVESLRHELDSVRAASGAYQQSIAPAGVQVYPQAPPTAPYQVSQTPRGSVVHPYTQPAATTQSARASSPM